MTGLSLSLSEIPEAFAAAHPGRIYDRAGRKELRFFWQESPTLIPVWWHGAIRTLRWGSKNRRSVLPYGPWVAEHLITDGAFTHAAPESVVIPANLGFDRGTWFLIEQGVRGIVFPETPEGPVAYIVIQPSTNYYRNMAGHCDLMPILIDQRV